MKFTEIVLGDDGDITKSKLESLTLRKKVHFGFSVEIIKNCPENYYPFEKVLVSVTVKGIQN